MLAATPPMGWNTWNTFGRDIDETLIVETAQALLDTGLAEAGYEYVVIDDVWEAKQRIDGKLAARLGCQWRSSRTERRCCA